jgi:hypothetical protein
MDGGCQARVIAAIRLALCLYETRGLCETLGLYEARGMDELR